MRGRYREFQAKGADVAAIGMGIPEMAADFREKQDVPFPLLVDRTKETYRALEMKRGTLWEVAGPPVWLRYAKGLLGGHSQAIEKPKQDPLQLGGVVVTDRGGDVLYEFRSSTSSDNPPIDDVLAALP